MIRLLANMIIYEGETHRLSIVEISADGKELSITPFVTETAGTRWIDGTIEIVKEADKYTWHILK